MKPKPLGRYTQVPTFEVLANADSIMYLSVNFPHLVSQPEEREKGKKLSSCEQYKSAKYLSLDDLSFLLLHI